MFILNVLHLQNVHQQHISVLRKMSSTKNLLWFCIGAQSTWLRVVVLLDFVIMNEFEDLTDSNGWILRRVLIFIGPLQLTGIM